MPEPGMPAQWQISVAWLIYETDRLRAWLLLAAGRCPGCPKPRGGQHKFGCSKPGVPPSLHAIRADDHEENDRA